MRTNARMKERGEKIEEEEEEGVGEDISISHDSITSGSISRNLPTGEE